MSECNCSKVENKERALEVILTLIRKFDINTFEIQVFKTKQEFIAEAMK